MKKWWRISGLVLALIGFGMGAWAIGEACRQIQQWRASGLAIETVNVNVSSLQFRRQNLPKLLLSALQGSGALASALEIELTESAVMNDSDVSLRALERLKELDKVAYVRFASVYRRFEDVEEFMTELRDLLETRK